MTTANAPTPDDTSPEARRKQLIALARKVATQAGDPDSNPDDLFLAAIETLKEWSNTERTNPQATMRQLGTAYDLAVRQWDNSTSTGLDALDLMLGGGLLPKRIIGLLGAPGMGKSSLATQIGETVAASGRPVVYLTSEDSPHMLYCRSLARLYSLDYGQLLRGKADASATARARSQYEARGSADRMLVIEQIGKFSLDTLQAETRAHFKRCDPAGDLPGVLIVDYLQRLARAMASDLDMRLAVTMIAEQLRDVAKALNCTVMILSSQSRDAYKGGGSGNVSALATGKESGDLEYCCDGLMAIVPEIQDDAPVKGKARDRDLPPQGTAYRTLRLDKNRQGTTGTIPLMWVGQRQQFTEVKD